MRPVYDLEMRSLLPLLLLVPLCALPQDAPKKGPPAPKNLKVLKVPPQDLRRVMGGFTSGLGVRCDYCHIAGDFASDDNPKKEIARHMYTMVQDINGKFPDGKEHVTCYTCHRAQTTPLTAPPAAQ